MYEIIYTDGSPSTEHAAYEDACAAILAECPDAEIGHDGDLTERGPRTLCWACEEDSVNDDGAHAVASIYRGE